MIKLYAHGMRLVRCVCLLSTSTAFFLNQELWVWCVNIETGSSRTQTTPDPSGKDATSQNQTYACAKRTRSTQPCASSFRVQGLVQRFPNCRTRRPSR